MSDLIRREDALDAIQKRADIVNSVHSAFWEGLIIAYSLVQEIPSAEPERKKGEWIKHENPTLGRCMKIIYECSVCHKAVGCEYFVRRSFCPSCGADMRGER